MRPLALALLCLSALSSPLAARAVTPHHPPSTGAATRGFDALLVITADADWQAKWNTPPEVQPRFTAADMVREGGKLTLLVFVSNMTLDAAGSTDILCDYVVTRPDGSRSLDAQDKPCLRQAVTGGTGNVYLTDNHIEFLAEPGDQRGTWQVAITVTDRVSGREVPLTGKFELK